MVFSVPAMPAATKGRNAALMAVAESVSKVRAKTCTRKPKSNGYCLHNIRRSVDRQFVEFYQ